MDQDQIDELVMDARAGDIDAVRIALQSVKIPLFQLKDEFSHSTVLHMAAANGHEDLVQLLVNTATTQNTVQALISAKNESGNTALHWAGLNGHLAVVKLLCDHGADPFVQNESGHDAVYEAEASGHDEVIEYLLQRFEVKGDQEAEEEAEGSTAEADTDMVGA